MYKWAYFIHIYLYKICFHNTHWSKCLCLFQKKSYVHSTKKLSQLFFTVCSNKQQRQEEKLKITFNDNRPKLHLRNTYVQELCTCLRGALCCLKSNYFSKECHQDYSLESLTSGLFYKTVKQGLRSLHHPFKSGLV